MVAELTYTSTVKIVCSEEIIFTDHSDENMININVVVVF
jgi:hypothetical protein